jgi:hypothetical protein
MKKSLKIFNYYKEFPIRSTYGMLLIKGCFNLFRSTYVKEHMIRTMSLAGLRKVYGKHRAGLSDRTQL